MTERNHLAQNTRLLQLNAEETNHLQQHMASYALAKVSHYLILSLSTALAICIYFHGYRAAISLLVTGLITIICCQAALIIAQNRWVNTLEPSQTFKNLAGTLLISRYMLELCICIPQISPDHIVSSIWFMILMLLLSTLQWMLLILLQTVCAFMYNTHLLFPDEFTDRETLILPTAAITIPTLTLTLVLVYFAMFPSVLHASNLFYQ